VFRGSPNLPSWPESCNATVAASCHVGAPELQCPPGRTGASGALENAAAGGADRRGTIHDSAMNAAASVPAPVDRNGGRARALADGAVPGARMGGFLQRFIAMALLLTGTWYVLSGKFDVLHFGTGVVTAVLIAAQYKPVRDGRSFHLLRFLAFVPWLFGQVFISNLRVARVVLGRKLRIAPSFISQAPGVTGDRALTTLGCSVTLTPGTLTVDVSADEIFVHALDTGSARDIRQGVMAARVAPVFGERRP
jgi:multicomponent Na+:H+ antiporter subunit E